MPLAILLIYAGFSDRQVFFPLAYNFWLLISFHHFKEQLKIVVIWLKSPNKSLEIYFQIPEKVIDYSEKAIYLKF